MTALVALEIGDPGQIIRIPREAVGTEGSSIYLFEGEELTLEQLLYALLLESANDAATAIAVGLCGSMEAFAEQMNRKADALGLENTHFMNPHGLDHAEHYTTAQDLAKITREALRNEGYMLRKSIPLYLEPGSGRFEILFLFVPDRAGLLGLNPALAHRSRNIQRPKERPTHAKKSEIPHFVQQTPSFKQRKD